MAGRGKTIVLGAGAVGTASAWFLLKSGHDVEVIERQPGPALETSWGNGGVIHASEVEPWSQPGMPRKILGWLGKEDAPLLVRYATLPRIWRWGLEFVRNCAPERFRANSLHNLTLALYSLATLQELAAETGIEYDRANRGVLKIYRSATSLDAATRACTVLAGHGLTFERLDGPGCVAREPALADTGDTLVGGLYFPRDEVGDCNKFTTGLAGRCAERGATYHYGTTARRIEVTGGRVAGVITENTRHAADRVVVALGSFTAPLLRQAGVDVPIYPVKGVSITFNRGAWNSAPVMPVIDDSKLFGLVPIGDRMRISGSAEIAGYDAT
ncbi:MAG: FAD-dependent oxidoreductase, partial [Pseudomonadota bacterium]|nr:FAD-dependent oxidoreductase [Pseudomonadota bacterium]